MLVSIQVPKAVLYSTNISRIETTFIQQMDYSPPLTSLSLRRTVLYKAGQDLRKCRSCGVCSETMFPREEMDVALGTVIQLILLNDPEVFTCRTVWSDEVMEAAETICPNGINLAAVLQTLREEAISRGFI